LSSFFLIETLKRPLSAPFLLIVHFILLVTIIFRLSKEIYKTQINQLKNLANEEKQKKLKIIFIAVIVYILSAFPLFYKMVEMPPSGHEDDTKAVIGAFTIKKLGYDSLGKILPYWPQFQLKYHGEVVYSEGMRATPLYLQVFTQLIAPPGYFSLRLETTLLIFFASLVIVYIFYLLTEEITASFFCGALFNLLPWSIMLTKVSSDYSCYCFIASCLILSFLYMIKYKNLVGFLLYLTSLSVTFFCYAAGLLLAGLCTTIIPFIIARNKEHKKLGIALFISGLLVLGLLFDNFHNEEGFKWNISRAEHAQGIKGIQSFNFNELANTFIKKANLYTANYLSFLLPQFLFMTGDSNLRHNSGFGGQLHITLFIAFYLGLFYLIEHGLKDFKFKLLLIYLLISIIPAGICEEGSLNILTKLPTHAIRAACILPPIAITCMLGLIVIFKKNKSLFAVYLIAILINTYYFYVDFHTMYPKRLGNSWVNDQGMQSISRKAVDIILKNPEKKLFVNASLLTIPFYNLDRVTPKDIFFGTGILTNTYDYNRRGFADINAGDLIAVQEPFNYSNLDKAFKYILRIRNPYLPNNEYGASLLEIVNK